MLDTPLHVHANEDELFYILEGEHVVQCGEDEFRLGPGGTAFLPRGVPHSQRRVETGVGRLLALTYPAGFSSASSTPPSAPARSARTCTRASPRSTASPGSAERSQRAADQVRARAHDPDHKAPRRRTARRPPPSAGPSLPRRRVAGGCSERVRARAGGAPLQAPCGPARLVHHQAASRSAEHERDHVRGRLEAGPAHLTALKRNSRSPPASIRASGRPDTRRPGQASGAASSRRACARFVRRRGSGSKPGTIDGSRLSRDLAGPGGKALQLQDALAETVPGRAVVHEDGQVGLA